MSDVVNEVQDTAVEEAVQCALLFELENIPVPGRKVMYDVLKSVLGDKGIDLTPVLFSRYCMHASVEVFLPELFEAMGKKSAPDAKLLSDIAQGVKMSLLDGSIKLRSEVKAVIDQAAAADVPIGALTSLDPDTAAQLMKKLGFDQSGVELMSIPVSDRDFPTADAWLKIAKQMGTKSQLCMVYASSATACKAGLSAGMRCVAVPDRFTSFQDFGGADFVVEGDDTDWHFPELLELVRA